MRIALLVGALVITLAGYSSAHANSSILTYHGSLDRAGSYVMPGLTYERARGLHLDASFSATFPGQVYAQPLLWRQPGTGAGVLIVATEEDEVYAFDEKTGAQVWKRTLGEPAAQGGLHCGNIWPLGVTGTPVIDAARATLYLDAAVMRDNQSRHEIYALSLADGTVEPGWPVDVATAVHGRFDSIVQNQRGALALFGGRVFVPFGGLAGDCGVYHGMVVGVSQGDPAKVTSFSTGGRGGGIWAQGGVTSDGKSLFAATGNTIFVKEWGDGEAVLRFSPDLARPVAQRDFFSPSDWRDLDARDLDLGGTAPIPIDVPSAKGVRKLIFGIGKDGDAYLLDRDNLGGFGGQLAREHVSETQDHRVAGRLDRRRRRLCRAGGGRRQLSPGEAREGTSRPQDPRRPRARDHHRVVRFSRQHPRLANRHDHRWALESDRVRYRRRGRRRPLRLPGRHRRASRLAAGPRARHEGLQNSDSRRRQAFCHRRREGLRVRVLARWVYRGRQVEWSDPYSLLADKQPATATTGLGFPRRAGEHRGRQVRSPAGCFVR